MGASDGRAGNIDGIGRGGGCLGADAGGVFTFAGTGTVADVDATGVSGISARICCTLQARFSSCSLSRSSYCMKDHFNRIHIRKMMMLTAIAARSLPSWIAAAVTLSFSASRAAAFALFRSASSLSRDPAISSLIKTEQFRG